MIRLLAALVLVVSGCAYADAGPDSARPTRTTVTASPPTTSTVPRPTTGTAKLIRAELARVRVVAARPEVAGYKRNQFGQTWTDDHAGAGGHNGCDTRNDVLAAQLTGVRYRARSQCVVVAGTLAAEPYTGHRVEFRKTAATKVQIDHVYPLARAWDLGASKWSRQRRVDFANDQTTNLLAVDGPSNASKNDSGPGEWLPINRAYRCTYVLRYLQTARRYALPITADDRNAAQAITHTCP